MSGKFVEKNLQFVCKAFIPENCTVYERMEKMWYRQTDRPTADDSIIRRMHISCWRTAKATNIHSEYVVLVAFSLK